MVLKIWNPQLGPGPTYRSLSLRLNILLEMIRFTWNVRRTAPSSTNAGLRSCRASRRLSELAAGIVISQSVESIWCLKEAPVSP